MFQRRFWVILFAVLLPIAISCSGSPEAKKAKHLERGDSYFAEQKFKEAIIEYKNVIQLDGSMPTHSNAQDSPTWNWGKRLTPSPL